MTDYDLRCGDYTEVLADVERVDHVITDPPYGERTHSKQAHGRHLNQAGTSWVTARGIGYAHWTPDDVREFVDFWAPRAKGWICAFTSHDLIPAYEAAFEAHNRYTFAPIACVQIGMNVRLAGDGPSNWTTWLLVASRPRTLRHWGTLRGAYVGTAIDSGESLRDKRKRAVAGGKPLWLMRAIVRDYSRPGDLIVDSCAGGGTTLLAALTEGRRAIGAELDPATHAKAVKRLSRGYTPPLFVDERPAAQQLELGGDK